MGVQCNRRSKAKGELESGWERKTGGKPGVKSASQQVALLRTQLLRRDGTITIFVEQRKCFLELGDLRIKTGWSLGWEWGERRLGRAFPESSTFTGAPFTIAVPRFCISSKLIENVCIRNTHLLLGESVYQIKMRVSK